ncbi:MAG: hypothetical protein AAGU21_19225 [Solidesulfovibrio sp.]|uniref:hypothetical protein n=1 Tax=Solidesulfovibrio sp. TaxID=2910990 RepID=UPI002B1F82A6|nr:hypothetical protein [Solidesulfovibrio sp.]MEA4855408.1 hypothetical protein [Solidesulfovibrio sp.]
MFRSEVVCRCHTLLVKDFFVSSYAASGPDASSPGFFPDYARLLPKATASPCDFGERLSLGVAEPAGFAHWSKASGKTLVCLPIEPDARETRASHPRILPFLGAVVLQRGGEELGDRLFGEPAEVVTLSSISRTRERVTGVVRSRRIPLSFSIDIAPFDACYEFVMASSLL